MCVDRASSAPATPRGTRPAAPVPPPNLMFAACARRRRGARGAVHPPGRRRRSRAHSDVSHARPRRRPTAAAQALLNRYLEGKTKALQGPKKRRPYLASECRDLNEADKWRSDILREIGKKVMEIQNAALGAPPPRAPPAPAPTPAPRARVPSPPRTAPARGAPRPPRRRRAQAARPERRHQQAPAREGPLGKAHRAAGRPQLRQVRPPPNRPPRQRALGAHAPLPPPK